MLNLLSIVGKKGGAWNIYLVDKDGSNRRVVISSTGDDVFARFSRDGKILFQTNRDGNWDIYIASPSSETSSPKVLTLPATNIGKTYATLWGQIEDDGGEACQYRFKYKKTGDDYFYTSWTGSVTTGQSFSELISDLTPGSTYCFKAQAMNSAGDSAWGNEQSFVTAGVVGTPSVTTLSATNISQTTATLRGLIDSDGGEACEYSFFYWKSGSTYGRSTPWIGSITTGQSFNEIISGLSPSSKYYFCAQARNSAGEDMGITWSFTTLPGCEGTILLFAPNGGEELVAGSNYEIIWETTDTIDKVLLEYSINNGVNWTAIGTVSNTGLYEWLVPQENSQQCFVRISGALCTNVTDTSDDVFTIYKCTLAYDLNHDCVIDMLDFALLATEWLQCGNPFDLNCQP